MTQVPMTPILWVSSPARTGEEIYVIVREPGSEIAHSFSCFYAWRGAPSTTSRSVLASSSGENGFSKMVPPAPVGRAEPLHRRCTPT